MSTKSKDSQGSDFEPLPAGTHQGVCIGVVDLGTQQSQQWGPKQKLIITWEIPDEKIVLKKDGKDMTMPRVISAQFTNTLANKGKLRPLLESWRGRPFTEAELKEFECANLLGANCLLSVIHNKKGDKTYANIAGASPLVKGMAKLHAQSETVHFDLDVFLASGDAELPKTLHEWIKSKIMQSEEYLKAKDPQHARQGPTDSEMANVSGKENDEDVPF